MNFGNKIKRMARRQMRRGKINRETYDKIAKGSKDPTTVVKWKSEIERKIPGAPWLVKSADEPGLMSRIWEWLKENWPAILKLLLSLIVFLEPMPKAEPEPEPEPEPEKEPKERENVDS